MTTVTAIPVRDMSRQEFMRAAAHVVTRLTAKRYDHLPEVINWELYDIVGRRVTGHLSGVDLADVQAWAEALGSQVEVRSYESYPDTVRVYAEAAIDGITVEIWTSCKENAK